MAHFKRVKISFSTENPSKTIKNVIFFIYLKSAIIKVAISVFKEHKNSPPRSSGGYFLLLYIMTIIRRSMISMLLELTKSKFVKIKPYSKEEPHGCGILLFNYWQISQTFSTDYL